MVTVQTAIVCLLTGLAVGATIAYAIMQVLVVDPAHRHIAYYRNLANRTEPIQAHRGTPYRQDTVDRARLALYDTFAGVDDHNGSRKAPDADVVSLPRPRVTA